MTVHFQSGMATCPDCGKALYRSRKEARRMHKSVHPHAKGVAAYACPYRDGWHYGHSNRKRNDRKDDY